MPQYIIYDISDPHGVLWFCGMVQSVLVQVWGGADYAYDNAGRFHAGQHWLMTPGAEVLGHLLALAFPLL